MDLAVELNYLKNLLPLISPIFLEYVYHLN